MELVNNDAVNDSITLWWNVVPKTAARPPHVAKAAYVAMLIRIQRALCEEDFDVRSAAAPRPRLGCHAAASS